MDGYYGGQKSKVREMSEKYFNMAKQHPIYAFLIVGLIVVAILLTLDYVFGVPIYRKKNKFTERTPEGLRYDWDRRKLVKDDRLLAIKIMMKNYNLDGTLEPKDFVNFTDFSLVKFIEDSDEPEASRRAKVLLMLQPDFRKYQSIIMSSVESKTLPNPEVRKEIHSMLSAAGVIMPPLETTTDVQLIVAWQTTKSPIV